MPPSPGASVVRLAHAAPASGGEAQLQADVAELLSLGGDARIHLDAAGRANRYGCAPRPDPALVAFGSSTASTISPAAYGAAERLRDRLLAGLDRAAVEDLYETEVQRIREELLGLYGLGGRAEVVLSPSGTDLHLFAGQLIASGDEPPLAVIPEETETGSGVPAALAGRDLSGPTPLEASGDCRFAAIEVRATAARAADGRPRPTAEVDAEVTVLAETAIAQGRQVLVVLIDVSKTGLISPTPACAFGLAARFPGKATVLVDACQLRLSGATLGAYLDRGAMVAVTGSKFLTGPAFSAALMIPGSAAAWLSARPAPRGLKGVSARGDWPGGWRVRDGLEPAANFGLLMRWEAALAELRGFARVCDAQIQAVAEGLERVAEEATLAHPELQALEVRSLDRGLGVRGGWDRLKTIFPFLMRSAPGGPWLSREQTERVWRLMRDDLGADADAPNLQARAATKLRVELGQPVAAGVRDGAPAFALRLCLSSRLICEASAGDPRAAARLLSDARLALVKAAWLAVEVGAGRL
jgi:hypothetical protein